MEGPASRAPRLPPLAVLETRDIFPLDADYALESALEKPDRLQHRLLPRPRRPEQRDDRAAAQRRVDAAQHLDRNVALREAALQIDQFQRDIIHNAAPALGRYWPPCRPDRASQGS